LAKDGPETCYLCANGYGKSDDRKSCILDGGGKGLACDSFHGVIGTIEGRSVCRICNIYAGYTTNRVSSTLFKLDGNNAQMCQFFSLVTSISVHEVANSHRLNISLILLIILIATFTE
jgi:hypothetical protein